MNSGLYVQVLERSLKQILRMRAQNQGKGSWFLCTPVPLLVLPQAALLVTHGGLEINRPSYIPDLTLANFVFPEVILSERKEV